MDRPRRRPWLVHRQVTLDPDIRYFTNSETWAWKRCRRRWYLSYYRKLEPIRQPFTGPMKTGTRVHKALEVEYTPDSELDLLAAYDQVVAEERARLETEALTADEWKAYEKEVDLGRAMVEGFEEWRAETGVDAGLQPTDAECKVDVDSGIPGVRLLGKFDVRGYRKTDEARYFIDHKTVQSIVGYDGDRVVQFLHYHLLELLKLIEDNPGVPFSELPLCKGTAVNLVRRVKRTANAKPPFYGRVWVYHSLDELRTYWDQLHGMITDILAAESLMEKGYSHQSVCYPTPDYSCSWQCPFFEVCGLMNDPASDSEGYISRYLRVYDPSERYATDPEDTDPDA